MTEASSTMDWQRRARHYAAVLRADGAISTDLWQEAFERVPRHVFVPRFWALDEFNAPHRLVDGAVSEQHDEWLSAVYSDRFLATQWSVKDSRRMVTSSASLPSLVARMLDVLDVGDGQRVLEIGTGTGYNTALLCHRIRDAAVTSIDIDPILVAEAAERLSCVGYQPRLLAADGADGVAQGAPYDRIISTCASAGVPGAWIDQLADDGLLVAPFTVGGALAVLRKTGSGTVTGGFDREQAWFMPLRQECEDPMPEGLLVPLPELNATQHNTIQMDPADFANPDFRFWLTLHLPADSRMVDHVEPDGAGFVRTGLAVHTGVHRADAHFPADDSRQLRVEQDDRRLFDTVYTAWQSWQDHGRPGRDKIGITAHSDGTQVAFLPADGSAMTWPLPVR